MKDCKKCLIPWERLKAMFEQVKRNPERFKDVSEAFEKHCDRAIKKIKEKCDERR